MRNQLLRLIATVRAGGSQTSPAMVAIALLFPWLAMAVGCWLRASRKGTGDWRDGLILRTLYWAAALICASEVLGVFHALRPLPLKLGWGLAAVISVLWIFGRRAEIRRVALPRIRRPAWDMGLCPEAKSRIPLADGTLQQIEKMVPIV